MLVTNGTLRVKGRLKYKHVPGVFYCDFQISGIGGGHYFGSTNQNSTTSICKVVETLSRKVRLSC